MCFPLIFSVTKQQETLLLLSMSLWVSFSILFWFVFFVFFFMSTLAVNLAMTIIDLFLISDIFRNISILPSGLEVLS